MKATLTARTRTTHTTSTWAEPAASQPLPDAIPLPQAGDRIEWGGAARHRVDGWTPMVVINGIRWAIFPFAE